MEAGPTPPAYGSLAPSRTPAVHNPPVAGLPRQGPRIPAPGGDWPLVVPHDDGLGHRPRSSCRRPLAGPAGPAPPYCKVVSVRRRPPGFRPKVRTILTLGPAAAEGTGRKPAHLSRADRRHDCAPGSTGRPDPTGRRPADHHRSLAGQDLGPRSRPTSLRPTHGRRFPPAASRPPPTVY